MADHVVHHRATWFSIPLLFGYLVKVVFAIVEFIIGLRVILELFGANPVNGFVSWVYANSAVLIAPFRGIFPSVTEGRFVIDFSALFAMIVYAFIVYLISELMDYLTYVGEETYHHHDYEE